MLGEIVHTNPTTVTQFPEHNVEAEQVIRNILLAKSDYEPVPPKLRVAFRYANGKVGSRDVATHWLHSYPAKMFHRIPRQILSALGNKENTIVLDPYCGSGTVLIEAALRGNNAIGIDVNPLARLIAEVKSTTLPSTTLRAYADRLPARARTYPHTTDGNPVLDFWFKPAAQVALSQLRRAINDIQNQQIKKFFLVTLSSIVRRCSLADPAIPPPVRLSHSRLTRTNARYSRHLAHARTLTYETVYDHFEVALAKNMLRINQLDHCPNLGRVTVLGPLSEAADTKLPSQSVDVILTSPSYCGAQKYVRTLRLELYWLGFTKSQIANVDRGTLGTERISKARSVTEVLTGDSYQDDMIHAVWERNPVRATMLSAYLLYLDRFLDECRRVLRMNGHAFITLGTSRIAGFEVNMAEYFVRIATAKGFIYVTTLVDRIPSRGLLTQRHSSASTIPDEQVVWLKM